MSHQLTLNQINRITFVLVDSNNTEVPGIGTNFAVDISKNGAAFTQGNGTYSEIGSGWYSYILPAAECDTVGPLSVKVTAAGTLQQNLDYVVQGSNAGAIAFTYTLTNSSGGAPIEGAAVWVTTDVAGVNTIASGTTDALGKVVFYLQAGSYYFWRAAPGFTFSNPDSETVSA